MSFISCAFSAFWNFSISHKCNRISSWPSAVAGPNDNCGWRATASVGLQNMHWHWGQHPDEGTSFRRNEGKESEEAGRLAVYEMRCLSECRLMNGHSDRDVIVYVHALYGNCVCMRVCLCVSVLCVYFRMCSIPFCMQTGAAPAPAAATTSATSLYWTPIFRQLSFSEYPVVRKG